MTEAKHISVTINKPVEDVYRFASNPENLPQWASGLSSSIRPGADGWEADSPMGKIKIRFTAANRLGVMDHDVTLPTGETVHNPMRVIKAPKGSELIFTLFHREGMTDEEFAQDAEFVTHDLEKIKSILEK